eukprot:365973-Chlamydomonas_euryale.AAC.12
MLRCLALSPFLPFRPVPLASGMQLLAVLRSGRASVSRVPARGRLGQCPDHGLIRTAGEHQSAFLSEAGADLCRGRGLI